MNIIEEGFQKKEEKKKNRGPVIVLVAIVLVVCMIIGIISYLAYIKSSELKVILNGQINSNLKQIVVIEDDGTVYLPIKEVASYFGYESYNGDYGNKSEELSKCYVESEDEVANFSLASNKIYKLDLTKGDSNYSYSYAKKPIKAINGVLYASSDAIEEGFNIDFEYNANTNRMSMYTTPYLVEAYTSTILDYGYTEISNTFVNEKAIAKAGILIVKSEKGQYGVIDKEGNTILEAKYDNIEYLPDTGDFLVESNGKYGVVSKSKETKIQIMYDSIKLMDSDAQLYAVGKESKYGVIDFKGKTKIYIEYDEIGINISDFAQNGIKNNYILADNLIPVRKDKYWGLFNKNGDQLVEFKYDSLGYIASSNKDALNLLVIPDYNVLVACKDKKYTLLNSSGKELFGLVADDIYMTISEGKRYYYIVANNNQINAIEFLDSIGINARNNKESDNSTEENNTTNQENSSSESNSDVQNNDVQTEENNNNEEQNAQEQGNYEENNQEENNQEENFEEQNNE